MTRDEHLLYCKTCTNRKLDLQQGLICSLTFSKADFQDTCNDYSEDTAIRPIVHQTEGLDTKQLTEKLNTEDFENLKSQQNLSAAIICGLIVGILCSLLWGLITVATEVQIGLVAVGIGAAVGMTIRFVGRGIDQIFGVWGAIIAGISVFLGNIFSILGFVSKYQDINFFDTILYFDYSLLPNIFGESFNFMDLVFYGIAIYEGFRFSFRQITQVELDAMRRARHHS